MGQDFVPYQPFDFRKNLGFVHSFRVLDFVCFGVKCWLFISGLLLATERYCGGFDHILVNISVNSRVDSLMVKRSSVFLREELRFIIGTCCKYFVAIGIFRI